MVKMAMGIDDVKATKLILGKGDEDLVCNPRGFGKIRGLVCSGTEGKLGQRFLEFYFGGIVRIFNYPELCFFMESWGKTRAGSSSLCFSSQCHFIWPNLPKGFSWPSAEQKRYYLIGQAGFCQN